MTAQQRNWRELHDRLAAEHEALKDERQRAEQTLSRVIVRLCVAVDGLDPVLDPHLHRLREAIRTGYSARVEAQLGEFTDAVVLAGERRQSGDPFARLTDRLPLTGRRAARATQLWAEIAHAPGSATDEQIDDLIRILGLQSTNNPAGSPKTGLLGRFLGGAVTEQEPSSNHRLIELMQRIDWPATLNDEAHALIGELSTSTEPNAWVGVVGRVSDLVIASLRAAEREAQAAQSFLSELTTQLEGWDEHLRGEGERRTSARESADQLGAAMRAEVGGLATGVAKASSLEHLRETLADALQRIQQNVQQHLDREESLRSAAERREAEQRTALQRLEKEAYDLKLKLVTSQQLARRDGLTGLPNRRAYDERVAHEHARWRRFREPLSLVLWDVDNFKLINDKYGHKAGDRTLKLIAEVLQARIRETDFIARYGGEEFVVLLIGANGAQALQVAEQMREAVGRAGLHSNNEPVPITVSSGVTEFVEQDEIEAVFQRADQALYQAKSAGKNRCVIV